MKLVVFGGGDLAQRTVALLSASVALREIVIVTHQAERGEPLARLFAGSLPMVVRHATRGPGDDGAVLKILRQERPDIIFHAASMISPWLLPELDTPASRALSAAGFGLMLPAQLPSIHQVMLAVGELGLSCPVVNASYPDATHAVLGAQGLAPTVGVGNAGMLFNTLLGAFRSKGVRASAQLLAHHAQVTPFARRAPYAPGEAPWLFLDGQPSGIDSYIDGPLPGGRLLNALTASHAAEIIAALLGEGAGLRTAAPGPQGLQGGWPVRLSRNQVELDLPAAVTLEAGLAYQTRAAQGDGIARIEPDGTVHFTRAAQACLAGVAPHLAEPLSPGQVNARLGQLRALLGV